MKTVTVKFKGTSQLTQSRNHGTPKKGNETHEDYEKRTFMERMLWKNKHAAISRWALKNMLIEHSSRYSEKKKGNSTFTSNFRSGILVPEDMVLNIPKTDVKPIAIFGSSTGSAKSKGNKRVTKYFPIIPIGWEGTATYIILDDAISVDLFTRTLRAAGQFTGLGSFRIANGGEFGRFEIEVLQVEEDDTFQLYSNAETPEEIIRD